MGIQLRNVSSVEKADFTLQISCSCKENPTDEFVSYEETWELCNQLGSKGANKMSLDPNNSLLRLVPWGGVAALVQSTQLDLKPFEGVAYCFLPLPISTTLPVMVNGFFELSSNRRDVWQGGNDMTGDGKKRAAWNIILMREIIGPSYVRLLTRLKNILPWGDKYQEYWPSYSKTPAPWHYVAQSLYGSCMYELLLYPLRLPVIETSASTTILNDNSWISCKDVILLPIDNRLQSEDISVITKLLVKSDIPIVILNEKLHESLISSKNFKDIANPEYIRKALRDKPISQSHYNGNNVKVLLEYSISDLDPNTDSLFGLDWLKVLPTMDNTIETARVFQKSKLDAINQIMSMGFSYLMATSTLISLDFKVDLACDKLLSDDPNPLSARNIFFIVNEEEAEIFESASSVLLNNIYITGSIREFLLTPNVSKMSNIQKFEESCLLDLLRFVVPKISMLQGEPLNESDVTNLEYVRLVKFLELFWKYISSRENLAKIIENGPSLVPTNSGSIVKLSNSSCILIPKSPNSQLNDSIVDAMSIIGANIGHSMLWSNITLPQVFWKHGYFPNRSGILLLLSNLMHNPITIGKMNSWSSQQRDDIKSFLYTSASAHILTGWLIFNYININNIDFEYSQTELCYIS
jgi:hypothetical protein